MKILEANKVCCGSVIVKEVVDFFNPILISCVLRVYAEALAKVRNYPLTKEY